jgi:membrane-associated protease RseP (regulator of RpoE activity)
MLNMDMVGRVRNETLYVGGAGTAAPFDAFVKRADEHSPLEFKEFGRGGFGPSDHMSFAAKKVPVLFLFSGMHADYHRPSDTADKINYDGLAQVVSVARELTTDLATMPKSPYLASADSANPHGMSAMMGSGTGSRTSLGVIPDYGTDISQGGVRITGTSPGTPAAAAGLKDGDVLVGFGDKKIGNLYDLTDALANAKPGDKVKVKFLRDGKATVVEVTLAERRG